MIESSKDAYDELIDHKQKGYTRFTSSDNPGNPSASLSSKKCDAS